MGSRVDVDKRVFASLKDAFRKQYGGSKAKLLRALNAQFREHEEGEGGKSKDVISPRTLSSFFNSEADPGKRDEENLNQLCIHLLKFDSYLDAVKSLNSQSLDELQTTETSARDVQGSSGTENAIPGSDAVQASVPDYSELIELHYQRNEQRYGYVKPPTASAPVLIRDIYVSPPCSKQLQKNRRKRVKELLQQAGPFAPVEREEEMSGEESIAMTPRLVIWAHLGGGKTTFLKQMAARQMSRRIPIFISLKHWSEDEAQPGLLDVITAEFAGGVAEQAVLIDLLTQGNVRVLLDGLDEVTYDENGRRIQQEINHFAETYHDASIIITSRIGQYSYHFPLFAEVEIAPLTQREITEFVTRWFELYGQPETGKRLLTRLDKDLSLRSFGNTFMLLSMLCVSMDGGYGVPENRFSLFDNAVKVMLEKRDAARGIERETVVFSKQRKINFLCEIAYEAFLKAEIKYEWNISELQQRLRAFCETIAFVKPQSINDDIEAVLNALESHHGLLVRQSRQSYSFSSVAFQEYFAALYIVENRDRRILKATVQQHLVNPRWRNIFIMIAERLPNAEEFLQLLAAHANHLACQTPKINQILGWVAQLTADCGVLSSSWRAGCLCVDLDIDFFVSRYSIDDQTREQANMLAQALYEMNREFDELKVMTDDYEVRLQLAVIHSLAQDRIQSFQMKNGEALTVRTFRDASDFAEEYTGLDANADISVELSKTVEIAERLYGGVHGAGEDALRQKNYGELLKKLRVLKDEFPAAQEENVDSLKQWASDLRSASREHLNICHNVELTQDEASAFKDYLYVNNILLECLQLDSVASPSLRQSIRSNLLLPAADLSLNGE